MRSVAPNGATFPSGLNNAGFVTGSYQAPEDPVAGGFITKLIGKSANTTTFRVPGTSAEQATYPTAINNAGTTTGYYIDGSQAQHGFVRAVDGTIMSFDPKKLTETDPIPINKYGVIVGYAVDVAGSNRGFIRNRSGSIKTINVSPSAFTVPTALNSAGVVVGYYNHRHVMHGFLMQP
jgi:hypothetical protein